MSPEVDFNSRKVAEQVPLSGEKPYVSQPVNTPNGSHYRSLICSQKSDAVGDLRVNSEAAYFYIQIEDPEEWN